MKEIFTFYRAVDPVKGSWDGYGHFPEGQDDFLAFVTDAPSGASIHTPELIKDFWKSISENDGPANFPHVQLADALNRLQNDLQSKGRHENILYQATLAVVRKIGGKLYFCCIGDSVLQIYRGGTLYRLSESEVWDGALIATSGQKMVERQKTREIRFIGSQGSFIPVSEIGCLDISDQDSILLYTDGVEDLLTPDRLLRMLGMAAGEMRQQMEITFAQDKVKDDATLLVIPVRVPPSFQAEKEIVSLRLQLEKMQKENREMRSQVFDFTATRARVEKVETTLSRISQDVQRLNRRSTGERTLATPAGSGVSSRKQQKMFWFLPLLCLLIGTAAGAFLFRGKGKRPAPKTVQQEHQRSVPVQRPVAPPEIPSATNCNYLIQKGDSLDRIANSRNITVEQLLTWNPSMKRDSPLAAGKSLVVCKEAP